MIDGLINNNEIDKKISTFEYPAVSKILISGIRLFRYPVHPYLGAHLLTRTG